MAWSDSFHSHFVAWMKIILPVAALGLLSMLFLISRSVDPTANIPVAQIDLEQRAGELGVTNPTFAGVTTGGDQVRFRAQRARPDPGDPERLYASDVVAQFRLTGGAVIDITSARADMNQTDATATLVGDVRVLTSSGYDIRTDELVARYDTLFAETAGPVQAKGPEGDLTAGRMRLTSYEATGDAYLLFTEGVKLVYKPRGIEE